MLNGLRVLDLTFYLPGPYATQLLADLGAEIIKIENPAGGDPLRGLGPGGGDPAGSVFFQAVNRGKKSLTLNLKTSAGRRVFFDLAASADAVVEQFRPGVATRLGLDYPAVRAVNPRLTYVSITGYGQEGPLAAKAGHDINYMAQSGLLSLFAGHGAGPPLPPLQFADLNGGTLAVAGLLAGILSARLTGEGSHVDLSMTDGLLSMMSLTAANYLAGGRPPERDNLPLVGNEAPYGVYLTQDGRFLAVGALEPKFWLELCRVLASVDPEKVGAEALAGSRREVARVFAGRRAEEWMTLLGDLDVCVTPVLSVAEALRHDHVTGRGALLEVPGEGRGRIRSPFVVHRGARPPDRPGAVRAPSLGQDSREILLSLGRSEGEVRDLAAMGVI